MAVKVAIARCEDYTQEKVDKNLKQCLQHLGGMKSFVKKDNKVLLKINQLYGKAPEHAVTTHPALVRAVTREIRNAGGIPSVGDSPSILSLERVAARTGILKLCREMKVPLVELDRPVTRSLPDGKVIKSFQVSARLSKFDVIINIPKLKTHALTGLTCAVKNLFGCIPGKIKGEYHLRLQESEPFSGMLLDLHELIRPQLTIVDAVTAMEGQGPGAGTPREVGLILASTDGIAADTIAAKIVGMKEKEVVTILVAKKRHIPEVDLERIHVLGVPIEQAKIKGFKRSRSMMRFVPSFLKTTMKNVFTARPYCLKERCVSCGHCKDICPAGAIEYVNKKPRFDYDKCIRCYCCHEICPQKAIQLKRGLLARIMSKIIRT